MLSPSAALRTAARFGVLRILGLCTLWGWLAMCAPAFAVDTEPALPNVALQQRYENLTHQLRCLVCQDETIADSTASLAAEFRAMVHDQLLEGRSDGQIKAYMVARYGDYILLRPPVKPLTWLLWAGPFLLLLAGALLAVRIARRHARLPDVLVPLQDTDWD